MVERRRPPPAGHGGTASAPPPPYLHGFIDAELARLGLPRRRLRADGVQPGRDDCRCSPGCAAPVAPRAILAFSGALIAPGDPGGRAERNHAPVLLVHGEADDVVPVVPLPRRRGGAARGRRAGGGALYSRTLAMASTTPESRLGALALQRGFA